MDMYTNDMIYTAMWAIVGSTLGFFSFRRNPDMNKITLIKQCLLSIGIGLLVAYPITEYLFEIQKISKKLSIMLGTLGAFGLPEFILKYYSKLTYALVTRISDKLKE